MAYQEINESGERAEALYKRLRSKIETPENIGKMLVIDVDSEDYEIDDKGDIISQNLQLKHLGAKLFGIRIGYKASDTLGGILELREPQ